MTTFAWKVGFKIEKRGMMEKKGGRPFLWQALGSYKAFPISLFQPLFPFFLEMLESFQHLRTKKYFQKWKEWKLEVEKKEESMVKYNFLGMCAGCWLWWGLLWAVGSYHWREKVAPEKKAFSVTQKRKGKIKILLLTQRQYRKAGIGMGGCRGRGRRKR